MTGAPRVGVRLHATRASWKPRPAAVSYRWFVDGDRVKGADSRTLRLDRFSAPDPDIMWLPTPIGTPEHRWPPPVLLIEVSDTTYRTDGGTKLRKYAFHGVPEYWIENLREGRIEVYREPTNPTGRERDCRYASVRHYGRGETIELSTRPGVSVAVDELLP